MSSLSRHLVAVLVLPFTVTVLIPLWIARSTSYDWAFPDSAAQGAAAIVGFAFLVCGIILFVASLMRFGGEGHGTLAPWDPPTNLVVRGPYAYVRNPMISGVFLLLLSEGLILRSAPHAAWAGAFGLLNAIYILGFEEPGLRARFGNEFDEYARNVPRLVPRMTAWQPREPDA